MSLPRALALSIALHAMVLAIAAPQQRWVHRSSQPALMARLVEARVDSAPVQATPAAAPPRAVRRPRPSKQVSLPVLQEPNAEPAIVVQAVEATPVDPGLIARYRLETIAAAKRFKSYPPIARENGWQGRAEVRVSFGGSAPALAVSRSSGHAVLDRQAVETLAGALPALPPLLLGRSFELDFPVVFSLED